MSQQQIVVGLFSGGVATFVAPDGRPLTTAIRKSPITNGLLDVAALVYAVVQICQFLFEVFSVGLPRHVCGFYARVVKPGRVAVGDSTSL
jgi:hypothetical protein